MNDTAAIENPFTSTAVKPMVNTAVANTDQQRNVAEVQAAMMIARMNPRNPVDCVDRIINACTRPGLADAAVYSYARGGTDVTGPSIRLAETIAQNWGNFSFGMREVDQRDGMSVVVAYAWDMESNTRREVAFSVPHKRFTKKGIYNLEDPRDIYELVANQGARRLRACILAVIPGDVVETAMQQCEQTMRAKADTSPEAMKKMVEAFTPFGVTKEHIEARIQRRLDAIQPAQVVSLKKIYASLRDSMSAAADWFDVEPATPGATPTKSASETLKAVVKGKAVKPDKATADFDKAREKVDQATGEITKSQAPQVTYEDLVKRFATVKELDILDADATLIDTIPDVIEREQLVKAYYARREEITEGKK